VTAFSPSALAAVADEGLRADARGVAVPVAVFSTVVLAAAAVVDIWTSPTVNFPSGFSSTVFFVTSVLLISGSVFCFL
jgi:hypothetical protein